MSYAGFGGMLDFVARVCRPASPRRPARRHAPLLYPTHSLTLLHSLPHLVLIFSFTLPSSHPPRSHLLNLSPPAQLLYHRFTPSSLFNLFQPLLPLLSPFHPSPLLHSLFHCISTHPFFIHSLIHSLVHSFVVSVSFHCHSLNHS